jgi:hypothetical protein
VEEQQLECSGESARVLRGPGPNRGCFALRSCNNSSALNLVISRVLRGPRPDRGCFALRSCNDKCPQLGHLVFPVDSVFARNASQTSIINSTAFLRVVSAIHACTPLALLARMRVRARISSVSQTVLSTLLLRCACTVRHATRRAKVVCLCPRATSSLPASSLFQVSIPSSRTLVRLAETAPHRGADAT